MKIIILFFLFFSAQNSWALPKLSFSDTNPAQFSFEITDQGLGLVIIEPKTSRRTELKPKFTVSDAQKMRMTPQKNDRLQQEVELLLVVLSKGAQVQTVQVYIPAADNNLIKSSQTDAICEFENFGDFSWEKPADLNKRVRLIKKGTQSQLELKIGQLTNPAKMNSTQALWKKCFSF